MNNTTPNTLLVATTNAHKLEEIDAILAPLGFRIISLSDIPGAADLPEPDENAETFEENAAIKAIAYAKMTRRTCLADDSGLEVDALNGTPGVRSARYAGVGNSREERDRANIDKLLLAMQDVPEEQRSARFVCAMCLAAPDGKVLATSRGTFDGRIGTATRGDNGFGYDPLLILDDGRTSAELSPTEKNARSHRGEAVRTIAAQLTQTNP